MQTAPISSITDSHQFNPTQNYALVRISFCCKPRHTAQTMSHISDVCEKYGYQLIKNNRNTQQRFSIIISASKNIIKNIDDINTEMCRGVRKFIDELSISIEEIQEDAIVWYTNITLLSETL